MILEVVVDTNQSKDKNGGLLFAPLERRLRGALDFRQTTEAEMFKLGQRWPNGIPGMRIGLDTEAGAAFVADCLDDPEHATTKAQVARKGMAPVPREDFPAVNVPVWLFWLWRAAQDKLVVVTKGKLPTKVEKPPEIVAAEKRPNAAEVEQLQSIVVTQGKQIAQLTEQVGRLVEAMAGKA